MKAIYRAQYGEAEQLVSKDLAKPKLAPDKFLVEVFYNTINRTDCGILSGKPFVFRLFIGLFRPRSAVLGSDLVGRVIETGNQIKRFKVGDLVWGLSDEGLASQAEMVLLSESKSVLPLAPGLEPREAVACAEGGHYAINFLNKIKLEPKAKVLVNGATGAIGIMLLQLLKSEGAYVCAVGNGMNQDLLEELGADKFWDYEKVDFTKVETEQYDFIFDAVGKSRFSLCKPLLKKSGVYISSELGPGSENLLLALSTRLRPGKRVVFPFPSKIKESLAIIAEKLLQGKIKAVIDREYHPNEIQAAYRYVASGQKTGSVILDWKHEEG